MATGTSLGKQHDGGSRCQQNLRLAGMTTLAARLPSFGGWPPSLALGRRRIGGRGSAGGGGVLGQARCESLQALQEGAHDKTHTHRSRVPIFR